MKLIVHYNRQNFLILTLLFILSGISSYLLTKQVLLYELDESLESSMDRAKAYVRVSQNLPSSTAYDNLRIATTKTDKAVDSPYIIYSGEYYPENGHWHLGRTLEFTVSLHQQLYNIKISKPLEGIRHITYAVMAITMAMILLLVVILAVINRFFISRLWKPFYDTLYILKNFRLSNLGAIEFKKSKIDEFRIMNEHLTMVTSNASKEYRLLKEFTENASHEFQTPLTIIRSKLDVLIQQENFTEDQVELLTDAYGAVTKLSALSHSLLLLTKIENNQFSQRQEIQLEEVIQRKVSQFEEIWEDCQLCYQLQAHPVTMQVNPDLLEILLNNLFSNATRHNHPEGHIHIQLEDKLLKVSNTGINIPLDAEKVFSRFYKSTVNNNNNGLGLSIVRQICISSQITPYYEYGEGRHHFIFRWH
ncbi:signal transduction histidine kinase [Chitinophaga dinghuensis]|uniref:histidine kinase n=1 Tax=Chitinophaga dinghuensis TaxID=1539050 RepID=A0A327VUU8_9BACT|nr:HAMP domain-containing sensor histidine kinase [Chitinophaga dinghuensis]RAJ79020.1 signal transduction histidine kinase [Chitinophaga dinghuensis]